jgi:predicted lactoylglutathione lyase
MQARISMISLGVKDLHAAIKFYQQGLGLPRKEPYSDEIAFFDLKGTWLGLYPWDKLAEDVTVSQEGSGFRGVTLAHNVKSKEEVNILISQAVRAGATLIKEAQEVFWGGYSGYFSDLDGHLWEIAWNPHFWIGPGDTNS